MAYNIIIVDDSMIVRSVIKRTLDMCGLDIGELYEASNGLEALQHLEDQWIDIMFADINMPIMNGVELVEEMLKRGTLENVPVVIISTERSETRIKSLLEKGVVAYLNKPFTPEEIKKVVDKLMKRQD